MKLILELCSLSFTFLNIIRDLLELHLFPIYKFSIGNIPNVTIMAKPAL